MLFIRDQLNLFLTHRKLKGEIANLSSMHRIESNSFIKAPLIINYLNRYNLKTKKQQSFQKWVRVYEMVKAKAHLTEFGLKDIKKISKEINLITSCFATLIKLVIFLIMAFGQEEEESNEKIKDEDIVLLMTDIPVIICTTCTVLDLTSILALISQLPH